MIECHEPITKQNSMARNITKLTQSNCDMCSSLPCIMVCKQKVQMSHVILEKGT